MSSSSSTSSSSASSASASNASTSPSTTTPPTSPSDPDDQAHQGPPDASSFRKRSSIYNTFLSPSGSTSFFTTPFESRTVKDGKSSASSSGSVGPAASSSAAAANRKRRPSFEESRAQEPPQARLIRLRGLFDVLMHNEKGECLAGGRAKEAWEDTAARARRGAGGRFARGSLATKEQKRQQSMHEKEQQLDADNVNASGVTAKATSRDEDPPTPSPPRQGYANELLAQCRKCRQDLDQERQKHAKTAQAVGPEASSSSSSSSSWLSLPWPFSKDEAKEDPPASSESASLGSSIWNTVTGSSSKDSSESSDPQQLSFAADYEGESGYAGSGVWGLSAVKHGSRDRQRQRDQQQQHDASSQSPSSSSSSQASPPSPKQAQEEGLQVEWEGFLKYAESKERELYKIFTELDRNGDMRLDVSEIRLALDRAGIDLAPASLEDFIASLSSSARISDPHAHGVWRSTGVDATPAVDFVSWPEFRDYLLLLPRRPSVPEIYKFYQVRKAFGLFGVGGVFSEFGSNWGSTDRHGATAVTSDGDVSMAGEEKRRGKTVDESKKMAREAIVAAEAEGRSSGDGGAAASLKDKAAAAASTSSSSSSSASTDRDDSKTTSSISSPSHDDADADATDEPEEDNDMIHADVAVKFLLAGGIAGAVSRTATAPFDRLKIYLITASRSSETASAAVADTVKKAGAGAAAKDAGRIATKGVGVMATAVQALYREGGGLKAFWLGNGLNCIKIFPESAIKFLSYETSKRAFAKYVDEVSDSRDISGTSRFISGGVGGITSQLAIYPVETLKTRLMSSQGENAPISKTTGQRLVGNELLLATAKTMWQAGGLRVYYRGLTAGLVGVFPYSAIDMSTFEGIKLAYMSYMGKDEPETLALLAFGSVSGSVGATTVYPLNLIRTRLQAAGTPAHPQVYKGFMDAVKKTYVKEGVVGFYRGLVPTLAKVVPAVSISYVCYENSKKRLGVA